MRRFFHVTAAERELVLRVGTLLAIPLCFVVLIPSLLGFWLVDREAAIRSRENRALIIETRAADTRGLDVLVSFVCVAVIVRHESPDPIDMEVARQFEALLAKVDRSCA